ncbi:MAG: HAMP domain-containing sensor histidine kinase [Lysobacterales bacterium]|jgi:signal transduction histidine kinase
MPFFNGNRQGDNGVSNAELRAVEHSVLGGRRVLWAGLAAVLLPLGILLGLQYCWLTELEENSAIAREASLNNYLETITKEVHYFYYKISERTLNLPAEIYTEERIAKSAAWFKKREIPGARRLFVVSYENNATIRFFNAKTGMMEIPEFSDETVAVWAAASPWAYLRKKGAKIKTTQLTADQHDPNNRIILNPITDEHWKLVGLAGLIIDEDYFKQKVLPEAIKKSLPRFDKEDKEALRVVVRNAWKKQVLPGGEAASLDDDHARRNFQFVFTDWSVALQGDFASPEKWARVNFTYNLTLSAILALVLLAGIALTIRTALREMKLSAMKNEFVSNVSHELRTPLSSIRVFGEFMRRGRVEDPDKVREYGSYIETESRRLTQLINNILDFSRIESGRIAYTFEPADLEELLAGTLAAFSVRLRDKGFAVEYHGPDEPLPEIRMDANAIDRAVANLLDNAVKYSNGDRWIGVELAQSGKVVSISISDHGIGIPRDELERIFERFHRVSTGLVHDVKGSGLGLSLVKHIAEAHGGSVTVESEPGKGSTFTIHLSRDGPAGEKS